MDDFAKYLLEELTPDSQSKEIDRQRKLAEILLAKGLQQPKGEMVSGYYIAPSWTQQLAPLVSAAFGTSMNKNLDKKETELAKALRARNLQELSTFNQLLKGRQEIAPEQAGPNINAAGQAIPMPREIINVGANPEAAYLYAAGASRNPALQQLGLKKLTEGPKWEKAEFTDQKTGQTKQGLINVNSSDPLSTFQVGGVKPEMSAYERASLRLRQGDQDISRANLYFNTGMGAGGGGMPAGGGMPGSAGFMPMPGNNNPMINSAAPMQGGQAPGLPQYQYNPALSPKANQEAALKFNEKQQEKVNQSRSTFDLIKEASSILNSGKPSSGMLQNFATGVGDILNIQTDASAADAQLKLISGALTGAQPRFEGPQSNIDVQLYQKMAGDVGNANLPINTRVAALQTMVRLQKKYSPELGWDTLDLQGPIKKKNILGGTRLLGANNLSGQDREAYKWAKENPNNPMSKQILQTLGVD